MRRKISKKPRTELTEDARAPVKKISLKVEWERKLPIKNNALPKEASEGKESEESYFSHRARLPKNDI